MIDKNNIPDKWELDLATTKQDSDLISNYILSLPNKKHWVSEDVDKNYPMKYYISVAGDTYNSTRESKNNYTNLGYISITIEEFKKYILKLPEYQDEIDDSELEMIINNQLLTIKGDEIIKIKNIK